VPAVTPTEKVDPRSPRFGAAVTSVVLALVLVLYQASPAASLVLLLIQTAAFAAGSLLGLQAQPWGIAFRRFVRPRLDAPAELEDAAPPRFAQGVGLVFALAALLGWLIASPVLFYVAVAFALVAALLNAIFDFCLGCELYLLGKRLRQRTAGADGLS
jgi:hypothetical protein